MSNSILRIKQCITVPISTSLYPAAHLGELRLLVNESEDVQLLDGDEIEYILIVDKLDVLPATEETVVTSTCGSVSGGCTGSNDLPYVLGVVFRLLQFKDVSHKELLQILVGKVDTQLLKAVNTRNRR